MSMAKNALDQPTREATMGSAQMLNQEDRGIARNVVLSRNVSRASSEKEP